MKKIFSVCLAIVLIIGNISIVQASTNNTIEVSLYNIREIMIDNSLDMKSAKNNIDKAIETYDDAKEVYDDEDQAYDEAQKEYTNNKNNLDIESPTYAEELAALKKPDKAELNKAESAKENAKYNLKTARIKYEQTVESLVLKAQQEYIAYLSTLSNKELKESKKTSEEKQLNIYKIQYESGFLSKKQYDSYITNVSDLNNDLEKLNDDEEIALKKLHNTLGIDYDTNIIFNTDVENIFEQVKNINLNKDIEEMLDNNIDIRIQDLEIDKLDDASDTNDYDSDNAQISLEQKTNSAELDFRQQYNTLMTSYNSIKSSYDKLKVKMNDVNTMQMKYSYGFASGNKVDALNLELDQQNNSFESEKNQFYINYLSYIQMKEGY